jgi:uncharacterized protein (DUF1800 family)
MRVRLVCGLAAAMSFGMVGYGQDRMAAPAGGQGAGAGSSAGKEPGMAAPAPAAPPAAKTFVTKGKKGKPAAGVMAKAKVAKQGPLVPLNDRQKAQQMLNRFTFGARPGDVEKVMAEGPQKWFEEQLNPSAIPDTVLNRRLRDYPSLTMTADQAAVQYPDTSMINLIERGQKAYPSDPMLAALYEVQVFKQADYRSKGKVDLNGKKAYDPTDAEIAEQKKVKAEVAARLAGELLALPKAERMPALCKMSVADRIAVAESLRGDQKTMLMADFTPREKEVFQGMAGYGGAVSYALVNELSQAKMLRAVLTERQLQEVMADFWFNHFNVYIGKDADRWYTTSYDRDAIRANALGKFRDLLMATAKSPAMSIYLDNWLSIGPDSAANGGPKAGAKKGSKGLNENYGREVMELHTVGVNAGYTQADVTALANILTGWGVDKPYGGAGGFVYDPRKHEPGVKVWFGHTLGTNAPVAPVKAVQVAAAAPAGGDMAGGMMGGGMSGGMSGGMQDSMMMGGGGSGPAPSASAAVDPGMQEGVQALTILAASPQAAHFISWKLAQRFVADDPPEALVQRMAKTYLATDGDIKAILRTMVASPEFNSTRYFRNKVKTPVEYLASAYRTTGTDPTNPDAMVNEARLMGMQLFYALPPTGYYITADQWMNTGALVDRLNFAYKLTNNLVGGQKFDSPHVLALGLLTQPAAMLGGGARVQAASYSTTPSGGDGMDLALRVLETTMIGGSASAQTNALIHKQVDQQVNLGLTERLNMVTALVMGSPEFQMR